MKYSNQKSSLFFRRITFLILISFFIAGAILFRLFFKQVIEHRNYLLLAKNQYLISQEITPSRGKIFASDGFPLAANKQFYSLNLIPRNLKNPQDVAEKLSKIIGQNPDQIFQKINNKKPYLPPLIHRLDKEKAQEISNLSLEGVFLLPEEVRFYPEGKLASHILGFVNAEGEGKYGLEGYFNQELKGIAGQIVAEKDLKGRLISLGKRTLSRPGVNLYTTIDHKIQFTAETILEKAIEKFSADGGVILVSNPKTGAILAMAARPSFDPNEFNKVPPSQHSVFLNPAIGSVWEPGSVFKPIAMAGALDKGVVRPETEEVFGNMVVVDGHEIHTAQDKAFGRENMSQVLENSDNVAMVWVTEKLGNSDFYHYIRQFGLGEKLGITLDKETTGVVRELKKWRNINRATISFGQGISLTPLQLLTAFGAIANKGQLVKPYLIEKMESLQGEEIKTQPTPIRQVIKPEVAAWVKEMLVSVVERGHGKRARVEGYRIAGKTGTAQIPKKEGGYEENAFIGSFAGFFPADDPQFLILVKLDRPKNVQWAESSAAPVFGELARWILNNYQVGQ